MRSLLHIFIWSAVCAGAIAAATAANNLYPI